MKAHSGKRRSVQENGTPEVPEEERWVAQRRQASADVAHQEDEEDRDVRDPLAFGVGLQHRPNEEHRRSGGADEIGQHGADGKKGSVRGRRGAQIAPDEDSARNHEEAAEQGDERDVVLGYQDQRVRLARRKSPATGAASAVATMALLPRRSHQCPATKGKTAMERSISAKGTHPPDRQRGANRVLHGGRPGAVWTR